MMDFFFVVKYFAEEEMKPENIETSLRYFEENLKNCTMCARNCRINRYEKKGICGQRANVKITNAVLHFGEEPPLVENGGAGAVFFSGCGMRCVYCQNFGFSQLNVGKEVNPEELGEIFLKLQRSGARTLDLVTPEPHLYSIIKALLCASEEGLNLPVVFNTSSYVNISTLEKLDGIIDIYLADIRYTDDKIGKKYSLVPDYWTVAKKALREMYRQVGPFDEERMKGLIVRHLILPNGMAGTDEALKFISEELSTSVPVSLMSQYFPVYKALKIPEMNRKVSDEEYTYVMEIVERYNLKGWYQPLHEKMKGVYAKSIER